MPGWPAGYPSRGPWRFRNVTGAFDYWPLLDSVSISQLHPDGIMPISVRVEDRASSLAFEDGEEHKAWFDDVLIWAGHLRVTGKEMLSEHGPRVWDLTGQDYTAKLDDSVILTTEGERPRESIASRVAWILSFLDFSITTANVNLPSETVEAWDYDGSTVGGGLQQVSDEKLLHLYVDFTKDLHMFRTETIGSPFDLSTSPDYSTSFPYSAFSYRTDDIELTNAVRVKGLRHKRWVTDAASIAAYGRQESAIIDDSLITLAQVIAAGERRIYQLAEPIVDGSLECWEPGLRAGQTLTITDEPWDIDGTFIVTSVEITAVEPHDADGEAKLHTAVTFSDKRRVGRFPGGGRETKDANHPGGGGGGSGGEDPPGTCCNPVPTGPNDLLEWDDSNIMGAKQGHTSGTSHSFLLPDGSGYPGGVVGGDITGRQVLLFMMTADELPGGGGGVDVDIDPWDGVVFQVIGCTHGFAPFNNGHPNMQTRVYRLDVDLNPGEYPETGASVVVDSDEATEVLWITVLVGDTDQLAVGPVSTDWDVPTWSINKPDPDVGKRALYLSVAFNRAWDHDDHPELGEGSPLFPEEHDTSIVTGIPAIVSGAEGVFTRIAAAVGGEKTIFLDYAFSPVNTGTLPDLDTTGYTGTSSGNQDFIITRNFALEIEAQSSMSGSVTPGPTWEGGNPLEDEGTTAGWIVIGDDVVITSAATGQVWTFAAYGPPDLPTFLDDWTITQPFTLDTAGSLTDAGDRLLAFHVYIDGQFRSFEVRLGDSSHAQGVNIEGTTDHFVAKNIVEGALHYFKFGVSAGTGYAKMWLATDPEPDWDVTTTDFATTTEADHIAYYVSIGNNGGAAMVLTLPLPTIEGMALPGESVDWEIVGYGDNATVTFPTRYPYDELSLHVRVDAQMLNGTAFTMDGAAGTFTLDSAPYGDPSDPTGSSVIEARYTRA